MLRGVDPKLRAWAARRTGSVGVSTSYLRHKNRHNPSTAGVTAPIVIIDGYPGWATQAQGLTPGSHVFVVGEPGLEGRRAGLEVRDTLLVASPSGTELVTLFRVPIVESTVAAQVMKTGTGALHIDACRIGVSKRVPGGLSRTAGTSLSGSLDGSLRRETGQEGGHNPNVGRWPTNFTLVHGKGCRQTGTHRVPSTAPIQRSKPAGYHPDNKVFGTGTGEFHSVGYAGEDGLETVDTWECEPECLVSVLDSQSGTTQSSDRIRNNGDFKSVAKGAELAHPSYGFSDAGGASRFFPQIEDESAFQMWLERLEAQCLGSILASNPLPNR